MNICAYKENVKEIIEKDLKNKISYAEDYGKLTRFLEFIISNSRISCQISKLAEILT